LPVEVVPDVEDAIHRALALATEEDAILVTGSFYVIGTARRALLALRHDDERDHRDDEDDSDDDF
jgi:folylpolyglutamate synthase/dihydropteroate synthase